MVQQEKVKSYAATRVRGAPRPLREMLPLAAPYSLMVDPSNLCNFRCWFCPTGDAGLLARHGRPRGQMGLALFAKIIADLEAFDTPVRVLHLYKDGEPLANPALPEMVRIARRSRRVGRIETTTNGSLLTRPRARALAEAGLDGIRVSVYGLDAAGYRANTRSAWTFERIVANVTEMHAVREELGARLRIHCKIIDTGFDEARRRHFLDTFSPIADSVHIDPLGGWPNSEDSALVPDFRDPDPSDPAPRQHHRVVCPEPFTKLAVNFDGRVSACCADWSMDTIVGDVNEQSLAAIWNGEALREFRMMHLEARRGDHVACRNCDYVRLVPPYTDLDDAREELRRAYTTNPRTE